MDLSKAFEILEINSNEYSSLTLENLKKKYHKLALLNHPDKNGNTTLSKNKFQEILEAYEYVKREINLITSKKEVEEETETETDVDFNNFVFLFINEIFQGKNTDLFTEIIKDIITGCKKITLKLFENIEKDLSLEIYIFLTKHQKIFHISLETLDQVKTIILEKCKEDQVFILNPSLEDLFENNIFKLIVEEKLYFVPLWHSECYFDGINGDIIVKCIPNLPENIEIDEENNILVNVKLPFSFSLLHQKKIPILLEENLFIEIFSKDLRLERFQTIILKNKGISKITNNIHEIENKSDIILTIIFIEE